MCSHYLFAVFAFLCVLPSVAPDGKRMAMKVVDEPTNYGMGYGFNYNQAQQETNTLHLRIKPSNFSGPPHLKRLLGKCFTKVENLYKYELCPFNNITQHEQSLRWNPYSGVLGVWEEWEIANNTFVAMMMREGDSCGSVFRSTKVLFECGRQHELANISEPNTCQYSIILRSPLVCHPHSMLVYPTLPSHLQREWDRLEGQLLQGEITQQGYNKFLHNKVFEKAGYVLAESERSAMAEQAAQQEKQAEKEKNGDFETLYKCSEEYKKLKTEIDGLRALLELHGISENDVPHRDLHDDDSDDVHRMVIEDTDDY